MTRYDICHHINVPKILTLISPHFHLLMLVKILEVVKVILLVMILMQVKILTQVKIEEVAKIHIIR